MSSNTTNDTNISIQDKRDADDFAYLISLFQNTHYYEDAPIGSIQRRVYELGKETGSTILDIIDKIKLFNPYQ
jgi:hypothetical protein